MGTVTNLRSSAVKPSPVFLAVLGASVICGLICWKYTFLYNDKGAQFAVFGFVILGWIVSLCLHEFGHAYLAYRSGDRSQATRGYLTLNPLKYADTWLSFLLPVIFILVGGIGLPGGAVWIDRGSIPGRLRHSLVSAAGPVANLVIAIALAVMVSNFASMSHLIFWSALSYLAFLQVTAALLNLLPIPGLDGFGIVEPYLPRSWVRQANELGGYLFMALLFLLWFHPVNKAFFTTVFHITDWFNIDSRLIAEGDALFRFWTH